MTNRKTTKKALVTSIISLLLCVSMLVGTTFAWFTDSVTSGVNQIVAGNLDIELEYLVNGKWEKVTENTNVFEENTLWEPGHTEVVYLKVSNLGSLALDYRLGVNIASETGSINVDGKNFLLSDYIMVGVVTGLDETKLFADRDAARAADFSYNTEIKDGYAQFGSLMPVGKGTSSEYVCLVVYMPEEVGNEANYRTGEATPQITLGIDLFATQETYEKDSFDDQYDKNAAAGTVLVPAPNSGATHVSVEAWNLDAKEKAATAEIPVAALDPEATEVTLNVVRTEQDKNIQVNADQAAQSFDVAVTGIKENNNEEIKVQLQIGEGLTGIELYHKGVKIDYASYSKGYLTFYTTSFSPFTVVYDAEAKEPTQTDVPQATVVNISNEWANKKLDWKGYGGFNPSNLDQQLEVVYSFVAPHDGQTVQDCIYKDWECDFYVMCDKDVPAGAVCLGGNYGEYGWVGFENIDMAVSAGTEVPLLGSVGLPWTYADVAGLVGQFWCGVARTYGSDMTVLEGATFTVMLRLTNPDNPDEFYNVSTVEYVFPAVNSGN